MNDRLSMERFRVLADVYGGVIARWPDDHRRAAAQTAVAPEAAAILADALALDQVLDGWRVPAPASALVERIVASGHRPSGPSVASRARLWWSGLGVAAALAGAVSGTAAVAMVAPIDVSGAATSFGDVVGQDS